MYGKNDNLEPKAEKTQIFKWKLNFRFVYNFAAAATQKILKYLSSTLAASL